MEYRSDKEIVQILADTIKMFKELSPEERRIVRNRNRWRYVDGTRRFRSTAKLAEEMEMLYDVADSFV